MGQTSGRTRGLAATQWQHHGPSDPHASDRTPTHTLWSGSRIDDTEDLQGLVRNPSRDSKGFRVDFACPDDGAEVLREPPGPGGSGREAWGGPGHSSCAANLHAEPWFFGTVSRVEAERVLLSSANEHGAFLLRDGGAGRFSLSVRDGDLVKHVRVRKTRTGFSISKERSFASLAALVESLRSGDSALCIQLRAPCSAVPEGEGPETTGSLGDVWEVPAEAVSLERKLGEGEFGEVWQGLWNHSTPVAIKTLKPGHADAESFLEEAQLMKAFRHPHLVALYAVCTTSEPFLIITELMPHGSLRQCLQGQMHWMLGVPELLEMAAQVASGMAYLEAQNYIHRDLAARNVLVGDNLTCKVADFGLARVIKDETYTAKLGSRFPIKWTAPEAINYNKFTSRSDVWSYGILLHEIFTYGEEPYPGMSTHESLEAVQRGYRMPRVAGCPQAVYAAMLACWQVASDARPTFADLESHFSSLSGAAANDPNEAQCSTGWGDGRAATLGSRRLQPPSATTTRSGTRNSETLTHDLTLPRKSSCRDGKDGSDDKVDSVKLILRCDRTSDLLGPRT
ncbi:tyrosine-protein kinase SRK2-like [Lethenteron reissneri]|uniref:tyrosine-protein kinase SRK2-like n=1 Tax=Lethenteron reissneri TaxID=7753 RepID=UPI002AB5DF70|nr:tyrosine-protein kinase SRK2-like [Lethenteron reissneri]